jgi:RNA polymerase sigma factor for flagellar operon FliA
MPRKKSSAQKSEPKQAPAQPAGKPRLRLAAQPKAAQPEPPAPLPSRAPGLADLPTEKIWTQYHQARKAGPKRAKDVEALRNTLMERHQPLVRYIAERLLQTLPKSIELDDLVSWGSFGLMDAIRGFEPERNIKFKTYCTTRIRGAILDHLRSQDWVPRLVRLKASKIERAYQKLTGEFGREPTHAELAAELQMEHEELAVEISSASAKAMFSLSEKWEDREDDSSIEKVDVLEDRRATDPIGELHKRDMMQFLTRSLTHKERFIIEQYYQVGHTMREIGEMLALTESRVCQIHSNVMMRLKDLLGQKSGTLLM